jgi:hypothetical protein
VGLVELSIIDKVVLSNHRVIRVMETHVLWFEVVIRMERMTDLRNLFVLI